MTAPVQNNNALPADRVKAAFPRNASVFLKATLSPDDKPTHSDKWNVDFYNGAAISINGVKDVRVAGPGILDGSLVPHPGWNLIPIRDSRNVRVEGIMLRDSPNGNFIIHQSEDVTAENVRMGIVGDVWGTDKERGRIRNILVENVTVDGAVLPASELAGFDADHTVDGVTFRNVRLRGQPPVTDAKALGLTTNAFVRGVSIVP